MRSLFAITCVLTFAVPFATASDKKEVITKVPLADLNREPEKFAGQTVVVEGIVDETPTRSSPVLRLERSTLSFICDSKPEVSAGERVRITAVCEYDGNPRRLKLLATVVEKIPGNESALPVTFAELLADPKKFDGKLIWIEGVLRNSPEAVEFNGEFRYSPRLSAGVAITCHGKPSAIRGERIRIYGTLSYSEHSFTPLLLDANAVEVVPR
ncbi:MAG: hypothetical protein K8U57_15690 [Planctomycetes bacterium]|nr:hypothetical protein [Planctomycetota bacterium]